MTYNKKIKNSRGFSLIEAVLYIGLIAIIVSTAIYFLANLFTTYSKIYAQKEVTVNIQSALNTITQEMKFGKSIYTPTSVFDNDSGQISIETNQNPPTDETKTYVDFYLDNGRVYKKEEDESALPLTSNQVKINILRFTNLSPGSAYPDGAQIFIEGQFNTTNATLAGQTKVNFTTSAIVRYK